MTSRASSVVTAWAIWCDLSWFLPQYANTFCTAVIITGAVIMVRLIDSGGFRTLRLLESEAASSEAASVTRVRGGDSGFWCEKLHQLGLRI